MYRKFTDDQIKEAVETSSSIYGVLGVLGVKPSGGSHSHMKRRIQKAGIDTSHFTGQAHAKGKPSRHRKTPEEILVVLPEGSRRANLDQLRRALLEVGVEEVCELCGLGSTWNNRPIRLEIDHIDSNWLNNRIENLRWLCPNCHYQETWGCGPTGRGARLRST